MRIGTSPNKAATTDYRPARVTACVLVSVPNQDGYYAQRFDVVRLCLASLLANTPPGACDLLVFDNGSCPEVVDWLVSLRAAGRIDYLVLSSRNIGKVNAYRMMFQQAPGEVVAYSDDDILFYPGWLDAHLRVLETFPRAGMVTGVPVRHQFRYGNTYLDGYLSAFPDVTITRGRLIPDAWERDFLESTGRPELGPDVAPDDLLLTANGVSAFATASHFQFVAPRAVMLECVPAAFEPRLMREPVRAVDERVDALGYARLSTTTRVVRHIGNVVSGELAAEMTAMGLGGAAAVWTPPGRTARGAARSLSVVRRLKNWHYFATRYKPVR